MLRTGYAPHSWFAARYMDFLYALGKQSLTRREYERLGRWYGTTGSLLLLKHPEYDRLIGGGKRG
jgi:hypothetical protein